MNAGIAELRRETARVRELAAELERDTPMQSLRYPCVVIARGLLERAEKMLASKDADDGRDEAVYNDGAPQGCPKESTG
jgi:hypothetical protein